MRCVKVRKNAYDILRPPYNIRQYNFVCTGSGLRVHMPYHKIMNMLRRFQTKTDPRFALSKRDETIPYIPEPMLEPPTDGKPALIHRKIVLGPDAPGQLYSSRMPDMISVPEKPNLRHR